MTTSWVIVSKETNKPVMETFNSAILNKINTEKYTIYPIMEWLAIVNRAAHQHPMPAWLSA